MKKLPLGEIFKLKQGNHLPLTELKKTGYSVFGANGKIGHYYKFMHEEPVVLVSCRGANCGSINLTDKNSWVTGNSIALINLGKYEVETKYLYYVLKQTDFKNVISGSAQPQIVAGSLTNLQIHLPPLSTQKQIIQKLDKLTELISLRKESIKKQEDLTKSIFIEMFGDPMINEKGWEKEKLGNISNVGSSTRVFSKDLKDSGIPFYRGSEITALSTGKKIKSELFISEEHYNSILGKVNIPEIGDLLLPSICSDGNIWQVNTDKPFYFKDGRVLWIHFNNPNLNGTYLKFLLKEMFLSNYDKISSGTTFSELKIFILKDLEIIFPPISLQNKFAEIVQKNEENIKKQKESLEKLEELYNGMMQESFRF